VRSGAILTPTNIVYGIASSTRIFREKHKNDIKNIIERIKKAPDT